MNREKLKAKTERYYEAAGGQNVGAIPWTTLFAIFQAILAACPAKSVKTMCKDHPVFAAFELTRRLMDEEGLSRKEARRIALASVDTIANTSATELEAL